MTNRFWALPPLVLLSLALTGCPRLPEPPPSPETLAPALPAAPLPTRRPIALPASGELVLTPAQSLTIADLHNVRLDDNPPLLGRPDPPYDPRMADDLLPGQRPPYVALGIEPFRLTRFHNEFYYGGWHTFDMVDYALCHGFSLATPYVRQLDQQGHLPPGTQWIAPGPTVNWDKWLPEHGLPPGRYDLLPPNLAELLAPVVLKGVEPEAWAGVMLDMEHAVLSPEQLRAQSWYPRSASASERAAFEKRYYHGYARTFTVPVDLAHQRGFRNVSLYGWAPYGRAWYGLEQATVGGPDDWAWHNFGKEIYDHVDLINHSVYCFYWSPQNVAYTLANTDLNLQLVNSMPLKKPVRPYYWTLLHGGGSADSWWTLQPLPNEEVRAMVAMGFFTGQDGFVCWNWSGTGSHLAPPLLTPEELKTSRYAQVREGFTARRRHSLFRGHEFQRYDPIFIQEVTPGGAVHFQAVINGSPAPEVYVMGREALRRRLRPAAEPISAVVEALALIKPFEKLLRDGQVKIDVPAQRQFRETLPLVRRVKQGKVSLLITYDPKVIHGGAPRPVRLENFDGHRGLTLVLPADAETRLWLVEER